MKLLFFSLVINISVDNNNL